jgi:hypothetical protein
MTVRFDEHADNFASAAAYLRERAYQALIDGFHPASDEVEPLVEDGVEWAARATMTDPRGALYQSIYIYASQRGKGRALRAMRGGLPVVTTPGCRLEPFLVAKGIPHVVVARITEAREYVAIERAYGTRTAQRSGVPLMRHIDEGLAVLARIGASEAAMRAFCIHPLVQADGDLARNIDELPAIASDPRVVALALEYRNIANATLSHRAIDGAADIPLSPLPEVNAMLIADKVQNRKDFILHHRGTHPRSDALDRYFKLWLERLGVSEARFAELFVDLQVTASPQGRPD